MLYFTHVLFPYSFYILWNSEIGLNWRSIKMDCSRKSCVGSFIKKILIMSAKCGYCQVFLLVIFNFWRTKTSLWFYIEIAVSLFIMCSIFKQTLLFHMHSFCISQNFAILHYKFIKSILNLSFVREIYNQFFVGNTGVSDRKDWRGFIVKLPNHNVTLEKRLAEGET